MGAGLAPLALATDAGAEPLAELLGGAGVEGDQVPERLAAVAAKGAQGPGRRARVPRHVLAHGAVGMPRQPRQDVGRGVGVVADEPDEVVVLARGVARQAAQLAGGGRAAGGADRKSTRLNSS